MWSIAGAMESHRRCPYSPLKKQGILTHIPPGQNGRNFGRRHVQLYFFNESYRIPIQISLKYVPMSPIGNRPALVQVMAWHRSGDKPLPRAMMIQFIDANMRH